VENRIAVRIDRLIEFSLLADAGGHVVWSVLVQRQKPVPW
jgi:hypothetical protein